MENHNVSNSNILLETLYDGTLKTVTLNTPSRDIGIENKDSVPTTPCNNQVPLETELTALKSFVLEQFFLIKKSTQGPNHEVENVVMLMEQIKYLKEENQVKSSIIQSLTNQYNNILNSAATYNRNNNNNDNNNNNNNDNNDNNFFFLNFHFIYFKIILYTYTIKKLKYISLSKEKHIFLAVLIQKKYTY